MSVSPGPGSDYYSSAQQQQQRPAHHSYGSSQSGYGGPPGGGYGGGRAISPGPMQMQGQGLHHMQRSPSPQPQPIALRQPEHQQKSVMPPPTRQYTEDGRGVLFYGVSLVPICFLFVVDDRRCSYFAFCAVQALYDYTATIPEEFSFQAGDVIAVTSTPEDGWWSGELMDEARRVPGKHIFPSNFVKLF